MEQRIKALEEEVKLLKNEIQSVLLDIKENLASGEWMMTRATGVAGDNVVDDGLAVDKADGGKDGDAVMGVEEPVNATQLIRREGRASNSQRKEEESHAPSSFETKKRQQNRGVNDVQTNEISDGSKDQQGKGIDALTLVMLVEWLEKNRKELGREETERMVEVYAASGKMSEAECQALRLVNGIWGREDGAETVTRLLKLDEIMHPRDSARNLQSALISLMASQKSEKISTAISAVIQKKPDSDE